MSIFNFVNPNPKYGVITHILTLILTCIIGFKTDS